MSDLIVSDGTSWVLASNGLGVAVVRAWKSAEQIRRAYSGNFGAITDEEYAACVAWTFPAIHDEAMYDEADVRCRCGQWMSLNEVEPTIQCEYCGRRYRVRLEEVIDDE